MKTTVRFYKDDTWYADVQGVSKAENRMVAGADLFLEYLSKGKDSVTLEVQDTKPENPIYSLKRILHDKWGGTYAIMGNGKLSLCWLCNVTHKVLGEHPKNIYITDIR